MMREIKVRGLNIVTKEWTYGFGVNFAEITDKLAAIYNKSGYELVIPESVGQFTGIKDKLNEDIYAGDILKVVPRNLEHYEVSIFFVVEDQSPWGVTFDWQHVSGYECSTHIMQWDEENEKHLNVEVIGNIYENPELLEGVNVG